MSPQRRLFLAAWSVPLFVTLTLGLLALGIYFHQHIWRFGGEDYYCSGAPAHGFRGDLEACYRNIMIVWRGRDALFVLSGLSFFATIAAAIWRGHVFEELLDVEIDVGSDVDTSD